MKYCPKCGTDRELSDFHKNKSTKTGLSDWCKECNNYYYTRFSESKREKARERYWKNPEKAREMRSRTRDKDKHREGERIRRIKYNSRSDKEIAEQRARLRPNNLKKCRKCEESLSFLMFHLNRGLPDGLTADCRVCVKLSKRKLERIAEFSSRGLSECVYCGGDYEDVDHVMPVKLGGLDTKENLVPSCSRCNKKKNAKHPEDWFREALPNEDIDRLLRRWGVDKTWENH